MLPLLQVESLKKSFGDLLLFDELSFGIGEGQRVALVAKNGAGKTTLLNIIAGLDTPDCGSVTFRNGTRAGFLEQRDRFADALTIRQALFAMDNPVAQAACAYEEAVLRGAGVAEAAVQMDACRAWDFEQRAQEILSRLRIDSFNARIGELSGGQRKRVSLAAVLLGEPDFLILDEPTNHLDLDMVEWLEEYLSRARSTLLMVTHDRYFLDRVCNVILEIDRQRLYSYRGNFSYFLEKRQERIDAANAEVERASNLFRRELEWMRSTPSARSTKIKARISAFDDIKERAGARRHDGQVEISVGSQRLGKKIIEAKNVCKTYDGTAYIDHFTYTFARGEKIGITGKNGAGKTTLLNLLSGAVEPTSGHVSRGETVAIGYYRQEGIVAGDEKRVIDVVRDIAEYVKMADGTNLSAAQFLNHFLFPPAVQQTPVRKLSGGERRRLYLLTILMRQPNFLILDEPTNDLDLMTLAVLEDYLRTFDGCVLLVSHDRYFMDKIVDHLFVFEDIGRIRDFPGSYTGYRAARILQERAVRSAVRSDAAAKKDVGADRKKPADSAAAPRKLTFAERREYEALPAALEALESEKAALEAALSSGTLPHDELHAKSERIAALVGLIADKEMRWLELDEKLSLCEMKN